MKKLYKENGLLSEHGEVVTHPVKMAVWKLLRMDEQVKQMSESELRVFGGNLSKIVGDLISERIQEKNEMAKSLAEMEDAEFERLLKKKYGDRWMFVTLANEELERARTISSEDIKKAQEELAKCDITYPSGVRFK
jgi:hypothetical protein